MKTLTLAATLIAGLASLPLLVPATHASNELFSYQPPDRGSASIRVGGGTRGAADELETLSVIAPDHVGLTTRAQPTLYWYVSKPLDKPVEITVIDFDLIDPVLRLVLEPPIGPGIHAVDLQRAGVSLESGKEYEWFVNVIHDPERRSSDNVAGSVIERVDPPADLSGAASAEAYASAGIWYDAIDVLSRQIDVEPGEPSLRAQRTVLLKQVGLDSAAQFEATR